MVMTVTESLLHECRMLGYLTIYLSLGQFVTRILALNGFFTTLLMAGSVSFISTLWMDVHPVTIANSAFRTAADVLGFLAGLVGFLSLLVISGTTELVFTPEALFSILTAGGLSISHVFLTIGLTYSANMSLFSFSRFIVNFLRIPIKLFGGNNDNAPAGGFAAPEPDLVAPEPQPQAAVAGVPVRRGRGRPPRRPR